MSEPLSLLTVHAHPDDESSKGAGSVALYHAEGVHTVLVCCTGGEEGEVLNPALDTPEVHARLPDLRREELAEAAAVIGYDEVVMLGYRDSGMAGSEANANPASFAQAPLDEAVARLVAVVRRTRPQVMVVYGDEQSGYPHPDHLRVHEIGLAAFRSSADPDRFPGTGEAWQPAKLYYTEFSVARFREIHQKFEELGLESPFDAEWRKRWEEVPTPRVTTSIDVSAFADVRSDALRAHATQVDPTSPFWFGLPPEVMRTIHPYDDYRLALVAAADGSLHPPEESAPGGAEGPVETDLFDGVRADRVIAWLSEEWFDEARALAAALPARPGLSARIQQQITGGPDGEIACYWVLEDGRPTSAAVGSVDAPDVTLTLSWTDAAAIQSGTLDPSVAFMQGRMKVAGSMAVLLALLPAAREPDRQDLHRRVAGSTDFQADRRPG